MFRKTNKVGAVVTIRAMFLGVLFAAMATQAVTQGANVGFGGAAYDSSLPVEITADQLDVNQTDGKAKFTGNVVIGQGEMRMTGAVVDVEYGQDDAGGNAIESLLATGGVTLFNGVEAAEASEALYTLETGVVVLTGDVILTQGENAMAGEKLTVNLDTGTGVMEGRVRVVFKSEQTEDASQ